MKYHLITVSDDTGTRIRNRYGDPMMALERLNELHNRSSFPWAFACVVDSETDKELDRVTFDDWEGEQLHRDRVCHPERYPHLM